MKKLLLLLLFSVRSAEKSLFVRAGGGDDSWWTNKKKSTKHNKHTHTAQSTCSCSFVLCQSLCVCVCFQHLRCSTSFLVGGGGDEEKECFKEHTHTLLLLHPTPDFSLTELVGCRTHRRTTNCLSVWLSVCVAVFSAAAAAALYFTSFCLPPLCFLALEVLLAVIRFRFRFLFPPSSYGAIWVGAAGVTSFTLAELLLFLLLHFHYHSLPTIFILAVVVLFCSMCLLCAKRIRRWNSSSSSRS